MSILNRYILKKFIRPFLASFGALCLLLVVSQIFDRLDRFLADGVSFSHVIGFLLSSLPLEALQILPVACLLATLFVVGNLSRTREYIAGLAGGLPPEKFLSGLFIAGAVISLFALAANETFVPPATRYARSVFREKIRHLGDWKQTILNDLSVSGTDGRMWSIKTLNGDTNEMKRVVIDTYKNGIVTQQVDALSAQWTPTGWLIKDGVIRTFDPVTFLVTNTTAFKEQVFNFSETPSDFIIQEPEPEEMTYKTLKRQVRRLSALGVPVRTLEVELMMKLSFPFTCFVVIFLGVPLALQGKGNPAIGIAAGGMLTLFYLGFIQFGKAMAQRLIEPWMGAWLGNFVFFGVGLLLWWRMRRSA